MNQDQRLDQLFALAKAVPTVHSFEQASAQFMDSTNAFSEKLPKKKTKLLSTKNVSIMLAIASTAVLSWFLLTTNSDQKNDSSLPHAPQQKSAVQESKSNDTKTFLPPKQKNGQPSNPSTIAELVSEASVNLVEVTSEQLKEEGFTPPILHEKVKLYDDSYQFPKLTDEEITANNKQKKAMLKALSKQDKKQYAYVPTGTFEYEGKSVSVQAYYMQKTEVSNLEYRTFLFDLLIQGRKDDFLKAKPDQHQWVESFNEGGKPYEEHYFSHKAYNDYPVVNVSREGAELYCKWISQELSKYVGEEKKNQYNDVRLPLRVEWVKAASVEGKQTPYPWNGPYLRDSRGLFQANFAAPKDSTNSEFGTSNTTPNSDLMAPVKSYWPNELDLYNMSGDVAEMVYDSINRTAPGTAGGSWRSSGTEIQITAPDPNKGVITAMPTIGFRVVMTALKK